MTYVSVLDQFEKSAAQYPSNIALSLENGDRFSYFEIDQLSTKVKDVLTTNVAPKLISENDLSEPTTPLVGIMMDRGVSFIVSMLGTLKAGCAYVPIDPTFPPDRQIHIFSHSRCEYLIVDEVSYEAAQSLGVTLPQLLRMDSNGKIIPESDIISSYSSVSPLISNEYAAIDKNDNNGLAYVLYTSGSTGKPKGVMVKHVGVYNIINWFANKLNIGPNSRVMGLTTFCFDISVLEIFLPLTRGGELVLAKSATQKDPFTLLSLIESRKVSVFQATPTTYEMMLATGWKGDPNVDFLIGGEAYRPSLLSLPKYCRSVHNVYGPTETTIWSTCYQVTSDWVDAQTASGILSPVVPIGSAISKTLLYIVSEEAPYREVEEYTEGELWIGGIGVAAGYLHAPELTVQRFIPNPFGPGQIYRTGDIVRKLDDGSGNIVFIRRMDDQVKIGGFRIELQEIENVFARHSAVAQAVAIVRNGAIVVYLKMLSPHTVETTRRSKLVKEIREYAGRSLTYYMMPKSIVVIDSFPQTANGKLDRKALPDPPIELSIEEGLEVEDETNENSITKKTGTAPISPSSLNIDPDQLALAHHICSIVALTRGRKPGIHSSFASIGIDSLAAVVFVTQLGDSLRGLHVSPATVFAPGMTILQLSRILLPEIRERDTKLLNEMRIRDAMHETKSGKLTHVEEGDVATAGDEDEIEEDEIDSFDKSFDEMIAESRLYFEGLRGLFAFFVLWDHFSPFVNTLTWQGDTSLFLIISGFTTSIQLRSPPRSIHGTNKHTFYGSMTFDWFSFILSRAVGIFPIMWLGLLFAIPYWLDISNDVYKGVCTPLYVLALETWWLSECHVHGPSMVRYASVIWNEFLLYALIRLAIQRIHNYIINKFPEYENQIIQLASNRTEENLGYTVCFLQVSGAVGLLVVGLFAFRAQDPLSFLPYYMCGVVAACGLETYLHISKWFEYREVQYSNEYQRTHVTRKPIWLLLYTQIPNILSFGIAMMLLFTKRPKAGYVSEMLWFPLAGLALIVIGVLQRKSTETRSIARILLSSPLFTILGYCSYPLYLFQIIFLEVYVNKIYLATHPGRGPVIWKHLPLWERIVLTLALIAFCWMIQKYYADPLSAYAYPHLKKWLISLHCQPYSRIGNAKNAFR